MLGCLPCKSSFLGESMKFWNRNVKVEGFIASYSLQDWWISTFTAEERLYIDNRYQPKGLPPHTLTKGKWDTSKPASQFLNELSTWFRTAKDSSIAQRIHNKVDELGRSQPNIGPGYYNGRHFTTYVSDVERLKKTDNFDDLEILLLRLIEATEAESAKDGLGVAPWYYEELAKIYRKKKDYSKEVSILERFSKQKFAPGKSPYKLLERLKKAKELSLKQSDNSV
jgi:hypothetical protein